MIIWQLLRQFFTSFDEIINFVTILGTIERSSKEILNDVFNIKHKHDESHNKIHFSYLIDEQEIEKIANWKKKGEIHNRWDLCSISLVDSLRTHFSAILAILFIIGVIKFIISWILNVLMLPRTVNMWTQFIRARALVSLIMRNYGFLMYDHSFITC